METPITKDLNDRINKHKERQFRQAINKSCCRTKLMYWDEEQQTTMIKQITQQELYKVI